ncbi:MAG: amidase [Desulfobacteraceae bacterium]|nr:amidase [Desulfobacteraceae bacterium]MBC2755678.1 amidase [Desulfobacteraceae bacterium]
MEFLSATKLVKAILDKRISSVELLNYFKERIKQLNPGINAIVAADFDGAEKRARAADEALAKGEIWGPLHGLPMTVKDSIEVIGMPCTSGFPGLKDHFPQKNADVVESLVDAGAIIFGKSNLPVFGQDFQSFNEVYGQTNNPWDVTRVPGGSSGGSAAALTAGLTGLEIGSDIGGSIRTPAHFCGVYGHKPTYDIISFKGHIPPFPGLFSGDYSMSGDIAVIGPLARSAEDLDLVMGIITKPAKPQRVAWKLELPPPRKESVKEYRVGVWLNDPDFPVDTVVADCIQHLVDKLSAAGVFIEEKHPDISFTDCHDIYTKLLTAVPNAGLSKEVLKHFLEEAPKLAEDDKSFRAQLIRGTTLGHRDWIFLDFMRLMMRQKWADCFKDVDVMLCPAVPVTAFPHDHGDFFERTLEVDNTQRPYFDTMSGWAGLTCVSYLPATVAPAGLAANGLPVGVQIVGPFLEDRTPIHFAGLIEEIIGGFQPPPGF